MTQPTEACLYRDVSADLKVPELAAFLRSTLAPSTFSAAKTTSVSLYHQGMFSSALAEAGVAAALGRELVHVNVKPASVESEVSRIGLLIQKGLFDFASRELGQGHYLILARAGVARVTASMLFLFGKAG